MIARTSLPSITSISTSLLDNASSAARRFRKKLANFGHRFVDDAAHFQVDLAGGLLAEPVAAEGGRRRRGTGFSCCSR